MFWLVRRLIQLRLYEALGKEFLKKRWRCGIVDEGNGRGMSLKLCEGATYQKVCLEQRVHGVELEIGGMPPRLIKVEF